MLTVDHDSPIQVNGEWIGVPAYLLLSIAGVYLLIGFTVLEFVCAYNLRGLLLHGALQCYSKLHSGDWSHNPWD